MEERTWKILRGIAQFKKQRCPYRRVVLPGLLRHSFVFSLRPFLCPRSTPNSHPSTCCCFISSFSPGGMRGWRRKLTQMSPADGWWWPEAPEPAGQHKASSQAPPTTLRGLWDTVGTVCLSRTAKNLESACQHVGTLGSRDTVPCRDGIGGHPQAYGQV